MGTVCLVRALCVDELTPTRLRAENRKFTNRLCGLQLEIESRGNAFDTFSWITETAHIEACRFLRPLAFRESPTKSLSLLPVMVVQTLLSPKLRPFLRSRWPLLQFIALNLGNPQRREFPSQRLLLKHVLELARPSVRTYPCPSVCVAYTTETVVTLSKGKSCVKSRFSMKKPLALQQAEQPLSDVQRRVLTALFPMLCLPYTRSVLRGHSREWVVALLPMWGKAAATALNLS